MSRGIEDVCVCVMTGLTGTAMAGTRNIWSEWQLSSGVNYRFVNKLPCVGLQGGESK